MPAASSSSATARPPRHFRHSTLPPTPCTARKASPMRQILVLVHCGRAACRRSRRLPAVQCRAIAAGQFRTKAVRRGDVTLVVNSTGTVQPVVSVQVARSSPVRSRTCASISTTKVKKDQVLAQIDPRTSYQATVDQKARRSTMSRPTWRGWRRPAGPRRFAERREIAEDAGAFAGKPSFDSDLAPIALAGQRWRPAAAINQAEAISGRPTRISTSRDIKSPVDGIVIDRKVDPGQTLAASSRRR